MSAAEVRECYALCGSGLDFKRVANERREAFDRWLAEHDREVAAKTLRDAADEVDLDLRLTAVRRITLHDAASATQEWLTARADRIAHGEGS